MIPAVTTSELIYVSLKYFSKQERITFAQGILQLSGPSYEKPGKDFFYDNYGRKRVEYNEAALRKFAQALLDLDENAFCYIKKMELEDFFEFLIFGE